MKRYLYLIVGTISMCIYGLMYNWTVFSYPVQQSIGITESAAANVFSICQIFLTIGGLVSGFLYYKINYKFSMIITSIFLSLGLFITSKANNVITIYLSYSFGYTFCAGYAYKSLLTAIMSHFNDKSGIASGILLMGAGLTAFVFNVPMSYLISIYGWRNAMKCLALIAFIITMISAILVKPNDKETTITTKTTNDSPEDIPTKKMIKLPSFWLYFIWSILLMAGCTAVMGNSVNCGIKLGINPTTAALLSTIISLANSLSRIVYGYIYDKKGRKITMQITTFLFSLSALSILLSLYIKSVTLLCVSFILIGLTFGAIPTVSNIYILKQYGSKYYPSNFAIQYLYSLISSIFGTMLFSKLFSLTSSYLYSYSFILIYAFISSILLISLIQVLNSKHSNL